MRILITLSLLLTYCSLAFAGGTSHDVKILSFEETSKDHYNMTFQRINNDPKEIKPKITLRLRHNQEYYTKKSSTKYTLATYREAIALLKKNANNKATFRLGVMGSAWGIPVKDKNNEYWVQTLAEVTEPDGAKVIYTFKD